MQTDLARILSVAGLHGLFQYVAQSRSGVIAESLETVILVDIFLQK